VYVYTFGVSETTLFSLKGGKLFLQKRKKNKSEKINNNNKKKKGRWFTVSNYFSYWFGFSEKKRK
jgi:hypothetical protein